MIIKFHEDLGHRGKTSVYYEIRKKYYWPGIKDQIEREIKTCEICQKYNRKTKGGFDFISTTRYLEKVALDLIEFREKGVYIIVGIDYFTRKVWVKLTETKGAAEIIGFLEDFCSQGIRPEEIITDNGKEFQNEQLKEWCRRLCIAHRSTSIESHQSNGRVERVIRTLRDSILKSEKKLFGDKVEEAVRKYNSSYHSGIGCTPMEEKSDNSGNVMIENSPYGKYAKQFKRWSREVFKRNQIVRVSKNENLLGCNKYSKGRFLRLGLVVVVCGGDSYIVKLDDGRLVKKRHYDLKGIERIN